jgi:hypothetical protein
VSALGRRLRWIVPAVVSVGVLGVLFAREDIAVVGVMREASAESLTVLGAVLAFYLAATLAIEAVTLHRMARGHSGVLTLWTAARIKAASYLAYTVHYALGVGAFAVLVRRRAGLALADAAGIVLMISAFDLGLALVLAALGIMLPGTDSHGVRIGEVVGLGLCIVAGFAVLRAPFSLGPLDRLRDLAVFRAVRAAPVHSIVELLVLRLLFLFSFISLVGGALYAFGVTPPLGSLVVNSLLLALVAALPIAVAGLGTGQWAFVELFRAWADSDQTLLACSLTLSAGIIAGRVGLGLLFAREYAREAIQAAREEETE